MKIPFMTGSQRPVLVSQKVPGGHFQPSMIGHLCLIFGGFATEFNDINSYGLCKVRRFSYNLS